MEESLNWNLPADRNAGDRKGRPYGIAGIVRASLPSLRQTDFRPPFGAPKIGALSCGGQKRATGTFLSRTPLRKTEKLREQG